MARYRFLEFELSEEDFTLGRGGQRTALEPKALRVLTLLVSRAGHLVDKQELLASVWPNTFVEENTLTRTIGILRRELGDSSRDSKIIETVPTRGYRFIAPVEILQQHSPPFSQIAPEEGKGTRPALNVLARPTTLLLIALCAVAIIAPVAIFLIRRARHGAPTEHPVTEQRLTSNSPEAPVEYAVVSPDGKYVAYSAPGGLYLRVIASGETRHWDVPKDFSAIPNSWFPDGTHLLVTRLEGIPTKASLWKLSLLGGSPRKLIDDAAGGAVSRDGTKIAFIDWHVPLWGQELWVMDGDGSNPHKIAQTSQPMHSWIHQPAWSPGGRRIACIEEREPVAPEPLPQLASLWTRNTDGRDLQFIAKDAVLGTGVAWSPDGRILFASRTKAAGDRDDEGVRSVRMDERNGKVIGSPQVVTDGSGGIRGISLTSDGKRLVLWRRSTHVQAFIADFDSRTRNWKTPRRLTLDANGNVAEAWLPDSRTVLFVSNRNGTWTLFKQSMDETTAEALVEGHNVSLPRLSTDDSQVLYQSRADLANPSLPVSLMRLPVAGGSPQQVLEAVGIENHQCARAPSTLCLFSKRDGKDYVFISFDPLRGIGHELFRSDIRGNWGISPNGKTLDIFADGHSIYFFSIENGVVHESSTVTLKGWSFMNGDWSADGKGLLVPSVNSSGEPVILEVSQAGKVSVVLKGSASSEFGFMIPASDSQHAILGATVPGDNNAWMIDDF